MASSGTHAFSERAVPSAGRSSPVSPLEDLMRRKGVDEAWDALEEMQRTGLPTDRFTVSRMLMKTLADARRLWEPNKIQRSVDLVEKFIEQQPDEADEVLFNALLDTHCRMKDISGLEATFRRMEELSIEPSHVTLGILVKAYGQACDIKSVLRLWEEMGDQRRQANAVTYGCMINACVRCGQTEKAVDIFQEMKNLRKHCNTILYTTLIKGYGNEKDINNALALFREMKVEGVPYNTIAYNSIIDVCIKSSDVQAAEDIFREMIMPTSNVQPDLITYSTLLKGYCQVGNLDKALQVAETIKACGLKCDELVYNTLMDGCVKANDLSAGVGLFAEMMQSGMRPSSITHSIFLRLYQRNGYKGNASDAVAQLYQHHGLERPHGLEKTSRGRGSKGKKQASGNSSHANNGSHGGSRGGSATIQEGPSAMQRIIDPAPFPPGYLSQAHAGAAQGGYVRDPREQPQQQMGHGGQVPPGRWSPQASMGQEAMMYQDHVNPSMGSAPYMAVDASQRQVPVPMHQSMQAMVGRGQQDQPYGILSSPSTYGGVSVDRGAAHPMAAPAYRGLEAHQMPRAQQGMQWPQAQGYPGSMPAPGQQMQQVMHQHGMRQPSEMDVFFGASEHGHMMSNNRGWDHLEGPYPSLLVQQRMAEEHRDLMTAGPK